MHVYVLRWLAVVSDCNNARFENDTRCARHKQYSQGHRIFLPYLHHKPVTPIWAFLLSLIVSQPKIKVSTIKCILQCTSSACQCRTRRSTQKLTDASFDMPSSNLRFSMRTSSCGSVLTARWAAVRHCSFFARSRIQWCKFLCICVLLISCNSWQLVQYTWWSWWYTFCG